MCLMLKQNSTTDSTTPFTLEVTVTISASACRKNYSTLLQVKIKGKDGHKRKHHIMPKRKPIVKSLSRRCYNTKSDKVFESEDLHDRAISALVDKACDEMKILSYPFHKSVLRESPML